MKKIIDVGVNLTDKMFRGIYNGKLKHQNDIENILQRAFDSGVEKMLILGGSLSDSEEALALCKMDDRLYVTVGCHPTNSNEYNEDIENYSEKLINLIKSNEKVIAIGECGLDYDREHFSPRDIQKKCFIRQLDIAVDTQKPLYLHCRAAHDDFIKLLDQYRSKLRVKCPGLVHTFDGNLEDGLKLIEMGFMLGVNGCSLKTVDQLQVIKELPIKSIVVETDAPWCDIRPSHAGYKYVKTKPNSLKKEKWSCNAQVKGRNEPVNVVQVIEVICGIREESEEEIYSQLYRNAMELFFDR